MKKSLIHDVVWLAYLVLSLPVGWGCIGALVYSVRVESGSVDGSCDIGCLFLKFIYILVQNRSIYRYG